MPSSLFLRLRLRPTLLLLLLVLLLGHQEAAALLGISGRGPNNKDNDKESKGDEEAATAAAAPADRASAAADWTRGSQQHQRPGRRRLESHVDGEEALNLLQHEPVRLTLEEAGDWHHVKRRLAEEREKSGFFHRVTDAFVPPNSALRRDGMGEGGKAARKGAEEEEGVGDAAVNGNGSGKGAVMEEFKLFERHFRMKRRQEQHEQHKEHQQKMGVEV